MRIKELANNYRYPLAVLVIAIAAAAGFFAGHSGSSRTTDIHGIAIAPDAGDHTVWTCSMHPNIRQPEPGKCPICGMDLIPVETHGASSGLGPRQIAMSPHAEKLAGIQTAKVERRFVEREIPVLGKVAHDETRIKYITSLFPGRIDRLHVDFTGATVRKGDRLADVYSPQLYTAQEEYLQALRSAEVLANSSLSTTRETAGLTVIAAREKLRLLGMAEPLIASLRDSGSAGEHITVYSPSDGVVIERDATLGMYVDTGTRIYTVVDLSTVWVNLKVYESDLPWIRTGQEVFFTAGAIPGETFSGRVAFINPEIDTGVRTLDVRLEAPNPDGRLKPGMFADASIRSTLAEHGAVISDGTATNARAPLVIPRSAALITGKRAVVYVKIEDQPGVYEGREIVLGPRAGDFYVVNEGLTGDENVVVNGSFKIDSALQILAKPSMMYPEGGVSTAAFHNHGEIPQDFAQYDSPGTGGMDHAGHNDHPVEEAVETAVSFAVPEAFMKQLSAVYDAYFAIWNALRSDSLEGAAKAGTSLLAALKNVDMALLDHDAHMAWMERLRVLNSQGEIIAGGENIAEVRNAFHPLSQTMILVERQFGHAGARTFYQFHCPMAMNNTGADWLQETPGLLNPYFGASMLTCGSLTATYPDASEQLKE